MKVLEMKSRQALLLILAVAQIVYALACFWEGGAWLCGGVLFRFCDCIRGWSVFGGRRTWNIIFKRRHAIRYVVGFTVDSFFPEVRLV